MLLCIALVIATIPFSQAALAGKYNPVLSINDTAPSWSDLEGVDGRKLGLKDLAAKKVVVVVFTCNSCPYAVDVEDRLIALAKEFSDQSFALVAINANTIEADRLPAMKAKAKKKGFNFPYLYDEKQQVAKAFGAFYTPEFFVLNRQRKVVYMGALDNSPSGDKVTVRHVADAVTAVLEDQPVAITETVPIGCKVRYQRARRKRTK